MGNNRDGVSAEGGWSTDWPEAGLTTVWKREIGIGFSSVSIAGGRLFTMGHSEGEETVYCLNVDTGETIWSHTYPSQLVANLYEGGPGSTPTIHGDYVYCLGKEGQLFCFRADDGELIWQRELQKDLGVELPEWGFNSSPYILGDQLIVQGGRVVSYDKTSGNINWQTAKHTPGYGSAALFRSRRTAADCHTRLRRTSSGRCQRRRTDRCFPLELAVSHQFHHPDHSRQDDLRLYRVRVGCGLFRIVDGQLELIYDNREMRNHFNNSILHEGYLYGFDGNSNFGRILHLVCMNYETGEVAWKKTGLGCGSLMIADGKLVILSDDGELVIAESTPKEFKELARARILSGRCWTVPVLLNGHVYARNARGNLVAVKLP